jgi:hypothetical protein
MNCPKAVSLFELISSMILSMRTLSLSRSSPCSRCFDATSWERASSFFISAPLSENFFWHHLAENELG